MPPSLRDIEQSHCSSELDRKLWHASYSLQQTELPADVLWMRGHTCYGTWAAQAEPSPPQCLVREQEHFRDQ